MAYRWIMWSMVVLIGVLSAVLLSGHGSSMIAGYNTASKKEKAKFDEKKLCRVTGAGMAVITVLLILLALFPGSSLVVGLFTAGTLIVCAVCVVLSNTVCKAKAVSGNYHMDDKGKKRIGKQAVIALSISLATLVVVSVLMFTGKVAVSLEESAMHIKVSYWKDLSLAYDDIQSVAYVEDMDVGRRTNGLGTPKLRAGHFANDGMGKYKLYSYTACKSYVVLETDDGIIAVNSKEEEQTEQLYEKLKKRVEGGRL